MRPCLSSADLMMKPYPEYMGMLRKNRRFNYNLSRARIVVEHAFGRLKGMWRCLMKRLDHQLDHVTNVIAACVVLHNICKLMGDECQEEWIDTSLETDRLEVASNATSTTSIAAGAIRDAFADHFVLTTYSTTHYAYICKHAVLTIITDRLYNMLTRCRAGARP